MGSETAHANPAMIEHPSPNHDPRPAGVKIDILLIHYTGMESCAAALERLCDPAEKVSAHYLIDKDGTVVRLVAEWLRAWHAGVAYWGGETAINARSIGIELVNPGHDLGYCPFPDAQMDALEVLATGILDRHPIPPARVLGHSDVAPGRKRDPGELFDWARLARAGIGLWPETICAATGLHTFRPGERNPAIGQAQRDLARFGYGLAETNVLDDAMARAVIAFQRHFRPARVDGCLDPETSQRLAAVVRSIG